MWTITPDYIQQIKDELKGRRAAIEARIADELKAIEAELAEIEQLERLAYDVAVKRLPELQPAAPISQPAIELGSLEVAPAAAAGGEVEAEAVSETKGSLSRWRTRVNH